MKQTIAIAILLIGLASCKKENVTHEPEAPNLNGVDSVNVDIKVTATKQRTFVISRAYSISDTWNGDYINATHHTDFEDKFSYCRCDHRKTEVFTGTVTIGTNVKDEVKINVKTNISYSVTEIENSGSKITNIYFKDEN